jgi:hypothetical protein
LPRITRTLPFDLDKAYSYQFTLDGKGFGHLRFQIQKMQTPKEGYRVVVDGDLQVARLSYHSETCYDTSWRPLAYLIREVNGTEIECEFMPKGVKERYRLKQSLMERFVPLKEEVVLLDNNGLHHLAALFFTLPLSANTQTPVLIFHPRRMASTEGVLVVRQKAGDCFLVELQTPYYTMEMTVTQEGKLVRYLQGKLEVILEKASDTKTGE